MKKTSMNAAFALIAAAEFGQFQHAIGRGSRRGKSSSTRRGWSTPHIGKKEQERAKRCYMSHHHNQHVVDIASLMGADDWPALRRSAPTLCQMGKRQYAALQAAKAA